MKFDCGETQEEKIARLRQWHPFFALLPRKVAPHDCRWLEWIERRSFMTLYDIRGEVWTHEYRAKQ